MTKAKALNVKNMKEAIVNYCGGDEKEFDKIYDAFVTMANLGFISSEAWERFFNDTCGWTFGGDYLIDYNTADFGGEIVFDFDNGRDGKEYQEYRA